MNHDKWKEALALNHPSACAALERSKAQDTESAVTEDDYKAIEARYKAGLLDLTKKALTSKS